ncbi:hypothetical protein AB0M46_09570 [Dactylosporangium sp. NPDC051485]|uniref:hypothetical protein n=1 Tax=Dactylosporangium sp. NPDC051485 TaxID=3154846 RepID=UPI003434774C
MVWSRAVTSSSLASAIRSASVGRHLDPARAAEFERKWTNLPQFRRSFRIMSAVWGGGLLLDAIVRVPLVLALSTSAAVTASTVLFIAVMVLLALWNVRFVKSIQARAAVQA